MLLVLISSIYTFQLLENNNLNDLNNFFTTEIVQIIFILIKTLVRKINSKHLKNKQQTILYINKVYIEKCKKKKQ